MARTSLNASNLSLLLVRVGSGVMLSALHGWGKIQGVFGYFLQGEEWRFIGSVSSLGFPIPAFFALCAALTEFLGGLLLAVGLFTRPVSALIAFTMLTAVYRHATSDMRFELAALYLLIALYFLASGPGGLSLDSKWRRR